jgi:predicted nucleic acid-binding protein
LRAGAVDCLILAVASGTGTPLLTMDQAQAELATSLELECTWFEA